MANLYSSTVGVLSTTGLGNVVVVLEEEVVVAVAVGVEETVEMVEGVVSLFVLIWFLCLC